MTQSSFNINITLIIKPPEHAYISKAKSFQFVLISTTKSSALVQFTNMKVRSQCYWAKVGKAFTTTVSNI